MKTKLEQLLQPFEGEHTPTPWKYKITGAHFNNIGLSNIQLQYGTFGECLADTVYREEDAKHIVHCVNNFEKVQQVAAEFKDALEEISKNYTHTEPRKPLREIAIDALAKVQAVLTKIEEDV